MAVFGRNGSGKTVFLKWLLSRASIEDLPWIVIDHKHDDNLIKLPRIEQIDLGTLPKHPGLYYVKASFSDEEKMDNYFHRILAKGRTGVFTDEGSSVPQREPRFVGFKSLFTQGRSKLTPVLFATQRPAWINKSILSESDFFACFHLQTKDDQDRVGIFMPPQAGERLDDYHSHWYDVKQDFYTTIQPVDEDEILNVLDDRLRPKRRFL